MTIAVDLGCKATKQTNKNAQCSPFVTHLAVRQIWILNSQVVAHDFSTMEIYKIYVKSVKIYGHFL